MGPRDVRTMPNGQKTNGGVADAETVGTDEQLKAELVRLRALDSALAEAASVSPVVLFAQDRNLRYLWVYNSRLEAHRNDLVGRTDEEILPGTSVALLTEVKRHVLETGIPARKSVQLDIPGHLSPRSYDLTVAPTLDLDGTIIGVTGIAIDVTVEESQRRELEAARAAAEDANRAKSRFLAAASHDLRQPFQAMHLFLHLLEMKLTSQDQRDLARKLAEALETGEQLLNALLDISALESGMVTPSIGEVPLGRLLRRLAEEFEPQAVEKGLALRFVDTTAVVRSDPVLLDRMLRNLIGNALRHSNSGTVLLGSRRCGGTVRIEVWDTGPGIPPEKLEAVFQEFVQLHEGARDRRQGLGLGLSIVKRTGKLLNHPVGLRSIPGKGSCFSVTVPVSCESAPNLSSAPRIKRADAGLLVAVAEDDRLQLAALDAMLRDWGCEPIAEPAADQLIERLRKGGRPPGLLIADFRLPDRDGPTLAADVRALFGQHIPVVLLTGDTHPEIEALAQNARLTLVHKPVPPNRLRRVIETVVGKPLRRSP